jgi:hypothetical protein
MTMPAERRYLILWTCQECEISAWSNTNDADDAISISSLHAMCHVCNGRLYAQLKCEQLQLQFTGPATADYFNLSTLPVHTDDIES